MLRAVLGSSFTQAGGRHLDSCLSFSRLVSSSCFVLPYPYLLGSYRFRSRWRCRIGRGVGRFGFSSLRPVPSSRSAARSISPYRFAGGGGAPFLSAHSPVSFVGGGDCFLLSSRLLVSFLVSLAPSRGSVSWLFFAVCPCVSSCSSIHRRLVASSCPASRSTARFFVSLVSFRSASRSLVSSSSSYSHFCPAARYLVLWYRVVVFVSFFLFSSHIARLCLMVMGEAAARHSHIMAACFRPHCLPSWNPIG